ncbi:hypothetical protein [Streptomyces zhihengii]
MSQEWIDPRHAELVDAWRKAQEPSSRDPQEARPVRGFILPPQA